ncbi:hypothetical protein CDD82_4348 [Ophiocordyceps australis]|uniref:Glucoamylase n=1 Tax=Ophiocordyceps australis TaxID=1399860 RepID=A0A2C5ZU00_9HYPO|nr:hypothetical protein CDD82_4348 [Ophiocordyceps australis]
MHFISTALLFTSVTWQHVVGQAASPLNASVDAFLESEAPIALELLLCNIGAQGCHVKGAASGVVVASPSTHDPDYFYTWTRDSALVFKSLVDRFTHNYDASLQHHIQEYIVSQAAQQAVSNPSGSLADGTGLGEPKFQVNLTAFTGEWGRPQRDGPPLRAIAMISYANWLIQNGYTSTVSSIIWPVVQNDLNYVAQYWNETGFDLWEEVNGSSFFTTLNQYRALVEGSQLAAALGQPSESYQHVAPQILCFLQGYWMPSQGYINANIHHNKERTGKDVNTLLGSIHVFDAKLGCDATTFQPCSDKALSNLKSTVDSFRSYPINRGIASGKAIALGRYIEDVYYHGNPWYLTTLAAAEALYDSLHVWKQSGSLTVTSRSLAFFQDLLPATAPGTYSKDSQMFDAIVDAVAAYADGFVDVVARYVGPQGSLAEQFTKDTGRPTSARHLTWSYASLLTAAARRSGIVPPSWLNGAPVSVPDTCSATSVRGTYAPATATSFPPSQTPRTGRPPNPTTGVSPSPTSSQCSVPTSASVTFKVLAPTEWGQNVKIVGNVGALGNWNPYKAVALDSSEYTPLTPVWKTTLSFTPGDGLEYKYIKVASNGAIEWEHDPNHTYTVPKTCATTHLRTDAWQS